MRPTTKHVNNRNDQIPVAAEGSTLPDGLGGALRVGILLGSTRPGRKATAVADWVTGRARSARSGAYGDAEFVILDADEYDLHRLDEQIPAVFGDYAHEHTRRWAGAIEACDAFVVITPEYNHSFPGALKIALDFVYAEWHDKAVGFVSYGVEGGSRAVEQLRAVVAELRLADVPTAVHLRLGANFRNGAVVADEELNSRLDSMLQDTIAWGALLRGHRARAGSRARS